MKHKIMIILILTVTMFNFSASHFRKYDKRSIKQYYVEEKDPIVVTISINV